MRCLCAWFLAPSDSGLPRVTPTLGKEFTTLNSLQTLHAARIDQRSSPAGDSSQLEALAYRHGASYDSYLATEPDRHVFWASTRSAAVAYARDHRYVHVAGGLLAAESDKSDLLTDIVAWADRERLVLSFYNLTDSDVSLVRQFGFQVTKWGEEALVDLSECDWLGKPYEWVRRQTNFCRRQHIMALPCDPAGMSAGQWERIVAELTEISQAMLVTKPQRDEIRFLEGRFDAAHLGRRRLFIARSDNGAGRIEGFLLCNPCLNGTRWAFETYRRRPDAIRGTMPYLMHEAMRQLQTEGVASVSLCLVPGLRCETPIPGDSPLARWSMVIATRHFSFIHDTRGMYHFKSRFRPIFVNRYLAVRPRLTLGSAWSFVRTLGVLDLHPGNLAHKPRSGSAVPRRAARCQRPNRASVRASFAN